MTLDTRYLFVRVIPLQSSHVRVLHTLHIYDQERTTNVAPLFLSECAKLIL